MIVIEFILQFLVRIFVEIIFEGIIVNTYRFLKNGVEYFKVKVFGFDAKSIDPTKALEKKLLYKEIELTENLNSFIKSGQTGVVLEVINKDKVFAEFYDRNGNQVELNNNLVFEIRINQFKLKN